MLDNSEYLILLNILGFIQEQIICLNLSLEIPPEECKEMYYWIMSFQLETGVFR